ncbi:MAG: hypothetical protein OXG64_07170 [Chloroflexi bacterium]|nr:hypothetical protein [Chloroflexota bacterium]
MEKRAKTPAAWLVKHFPDEESRQLYRELYFLGEVPQQMVDFMDFYEARRERLRQRIGHIVNSA